MKRREFLKGTMAAVGSAALVGCGGKQVIVPGAGAQVGRLPSSQSLQRPVEFSNPILQRLADMALQAARDAGATYADIRISDYRRQRIGTREDRVTGINDGADLGFGVRVIANGSWGFAASPELEPDEVVRIAQMAVAVAEANAILRTEPVALVPVEAYRAVWQTPIETDPFTVPVPDKVDRLLGINAIAAENAGVDFCSSSLAQVREHKFFASTEGSYIEQTLYRISAGFNVTSVDRRRGSFQTRASYTDPRGVGYEYMEQFPWEDEARQAAEDVVAKHSAPSIDPGKYDLVLHPTHLWLTIHESVGHPTELDRALGWEANYAGTSFATPEKLGNFRYGSDLVNLVADTNRVEGLASAAYDDDGVPTTEWHIINGIFVDYQTTRELAPTIGRDRSYGCAHAQSWKDVPFQRMPNINLQPGKEPLSLADLIANTENGILIMGDGSYSIDHQRYNFQFGGQTFRRIKNGQIIGLVNDVAYQSRTPDFWRSCDAICDESEYYLGGSFYCGKGEPSQSRAVSHGCSPARFTKINVINTKRSV